MRSSAWAVSSAPPDAAPRVRPLRAEIVATAAGPAQHPAPDLPEVAFAGRSNVGKSSLLNRLAGRRGLARTSAEPGKTRLLHFYRVDLAGPEAGSERRRAVLLVDLPGYGYAKVSKRERASWRGLVEGYLDGRGVLRTVVLLHDLRREIGEDERELLAWLDARGLPVLLVLTKSDKLPPMRRAGRVRALVDAAARPPGQVLATSAQSGEGVDALWRALWSRLDG